MKHKAIVYENIWEVQYDVFYGFSNAGIRRHRVNFKHEIMWSGEIDTPLMRKDDKLFIESLNKTVVINDVKRSTSGEVYYYTNENKEIETENTLRSKERAEKEVEELRKRYSEAIKVESQPRVERHKKSLFQKIMDLFK